MRKNLLNEKLDLIAKKTNGVFLSSALIANDLEAVAWVKFQQKHPEMFKVVFADKARIYQVMPSFYRFFYSNKILTTFKEKSDVLKEILHSSFVLDIGKDSERSDDKIQLKDKIYTLDTFKEETQVGIVITIEDRERAFSSEIKTYVPKNLRSKWGKICLQRFHADEKLYKEKSDFKITPKSAKDFIMGDIEDI